MSRVLNRPMFSMGGSTGSGITSGLKRKGYNKGKSVKDGLTAIDEVARGAEMYFPRMKKMAQEQGLYGTSRRLPRFLTQFGLNLMGMPPQGNIFQTAALAARDPYAAYASGRDQESMEQRKLNQAILGDAWEMSAGVQAAKLKGSGGKKAYQLQELEILEERTKENTKKLVTTCNDHGYMGDLFTYGDVNFIKKCWNEKTWYPTTTGLLSLGKNFINTVGGLNEKSWLELLKKHCSYRDPDTLKWVNLRAYYQQILSLPRDKVLNNDFDFKDYIWDDWPLENRYTENNYYN